MNQLRADKLRVATHRESELDPLRKQSSDLREKLKMVDRQIEDVESRNVGQFRRDSSIESQLEDPDFSPSSPPPYQP
jgi:hypothetical protein